MQNNNRCRRAGSVLVAAACAVALVGCAPEFEHYGMVPSPSAGSHRSASAKPKVPLPDRALLEPQAEPDCGTAPQQSADKDRPRLARQSAEPQPTGGSDGTTATAGLATPAVPEGTDANADLALRIRLEYERECYRQAEMRVRDRLQQLQASTAQTIKTIKTINRAQQGTR